MPHGNRISKSNQHPQRPQDQLDTGTEEGTLKSAKLFCNTSTARHIHYVLISIVLVNFLIMHH